MAAPFDGSVVRSAGPGAYYVTDLTLTSAALEATQTAPSGMLGVSDTGRWVR